MKTRLFVLVFLGGLLSLPVLAAVEPARGPQVDVTYISPENFTDFKDSSVSTPRDRDYLATEITKHIKKVAAECISPDCRLEVKFTDINLAGEFEPQRGPRFNDVRIIKEIYPPRMQLEFRLVGADGKVIAEGTRHLLDMNFQSNSPAFNSDPLRYDKNLLTTWLRSEFAKKT